MLLYVVMLFLAISPGVGRVKKQFSVFLICLFCYQERAKCSPFALTQAVRWCRHCWTAHAWSWSGVAFSGNSQGQCVYSISNVILARPIACIHQRIVVKQLFCLKHWVFCWNLREITLFCHNFVSRNITRKCMYKRQVKWMLLKRTVQHWLL